MKKENLKYICYMAVVVFIVLQLLDIELFKALSYSVSIAVFAFSVFDRWLWKYIPWVKTPRIAGKYNAVCESSYTGKFSYNSVVTIQQTHSSIRILETIEGSNICRSICASLNGPDEHNTWILCYTYKTDPERSKTDDPHYGTAIFNITKENLDNSELNGSYFTNRLKQTSGTMHLKKSD